MADEIRVSGQVVYKDSEGTDEYLQFAEKLFSITTKKFQKCKHNIGTSEEALKLGELTALGWCLFKNLDSTNYVELRVSTGGAKFAKVPPLGVALFYFAADVTAPYAIANTAACQCEYQILST